MNILKLLFVDFVKLGISSAASSPELKSKSAKKLSLAKPVATITPTVKTKAEVQNNLVLAFVPPARCIGIRLDYQKPEKFETPEEKLLWEEKARKEAEELKVKLELGSVKIESVQARVVINPSRSKIHQEAASRFTSQILERESALLVEGDFIRLSQQLRECLGLKKADVDKCLDILKKYKEFQLTKMMLLRNPDCVDSIRRLRRYIGNLKLWKLTAEQEEDFKKKAEIIRSESILIYNNFKKLFAPANSSSTTQHFWEEFCNQVQTYKETTKNISDQNCVILTEKTYKALSKNGASQHEENAAEELGVKTESKQEAGEAAAAAVVVKEFVEEEFLDEHGEQPMEQEQQRPTRESNISSGADMAVEAN